MRRATALRTLVVAGTVAVANGAVACPSCYGSVEKTVLDTYYLSTVMLSLLPFGLVATLAGVGWFLSRPTAPEGGDAGADASAESPH